MKRNSNGTVEFYGYCVDLIKDIQAIMGFEYELYEVPDGKYGNMDSKMNWNGMIKELMEKVCIENYPQSIKSKKEKKAPNQISCLQTKESWYRIRSFGCDGWAWKCYRFHGALLRSGGHKHFDGQATSLNILV